MKPSHVGTSVPLRVPWLVVGGVLGLLACGREVAPSPAPSASPAASSSAPTEIVGAQTISGAKLDGCPSAVGGARTAIANVSEGIELTVTASDAVAVKEIRARAARTVASALHEPAGAHTGDGTGSGSSGRCPVVLRGTRVTAVDVDGGSRITVLGGRPDELDWLRRETRDRLAELEQGGAARRVDLCPSTASGAKTVVRLEGGGVLVDVTSASPEGVDEIRSRGRALLAEATRRASGGGERGGDGKGRGGGLGRCPVVVDGAEVAFAERPDGATFTLRPRPGTDVAELRALAEERAAKGRR